MNEDTNLQISTQPPLVIADVSRCPSIQFINADCVEVMKTFNDKQFDLAIVDPPYGLNFGAFNRTNKDSNGNRYKFLLKQGQQALDRSAAFICAPL